MTRKRKGGWAGRVFIARDDDGKQQYHWLGRFDTKRERDAAVARARLEKPWLAQAGAITGDQWADRYLDRYQQRNKPSSYDTARHALMRFRREFGRRAISSITPVEAEDWAQTVPRSILPTVVAMFNYALRMQVIDSNPFAGLGGGRGRGRADQHPPTAKQLDALLDACDVLAEYAAQMRGLILLGAYTGMRPGELFALRWTDIDLAANRIVVERRLYRGRLDLPKSGRPRPIALPPPARDVLLRQPTRTLELVFVSRTGRRLTSSILSSYWGLVKARSGLTFDFYMATKHYGVHLLYRLGLSRRAIAAQMGWSERQVDSLLRVYGHADIVALAEIDALYADPNDTIGTHEPLENA